MIRDIGRLRKLGKFNRANKSLEQTGELLRFIGNAVQCKFGMNWGRCSLAALSRGINMRPWVTNKSEYIIHDKWLTLRADNCKTSNGFIIRPYYVFEYPDWVHVIALDHKSHILITRQYRHAVGKICAEIPCGALHPNEKAVEAAERELLEETGCTAEGFALFASLHPNPASHTNTIHCFLASNTAVTQKPDQEESEEIMCEFLPIQSVLDLIDSGEFSQALHVASLMLALRKQDLI